MMGRRPKGGTIVPLYEAPEHLSPASLRYIWKERFDDRAFWAAVLSLVSKGLATLKSAGGEAVLHLAPGANVKTVLPQEERLLFDKLLAHSGHKGVRLSMLDGETAAVAAEMANELHNEDLGVWFQENSGCIKAGVFFSAIAVVLAARPGSSEQWFALGISFAVMAPAAYYLPFLILRIRDLFRTARSKLDLQVASRAAAPMMWVVPCLAGLTLGCVELGGTFGGTTVVVAAVMAVADVSFLRFMRTPTEQGWQLLDEIEGFRVFLNEVDQPMMDRAEAPHAQPGTYEKYLPYALALGVEQGWSDRFVALASTLHRAEGMTGAESFYLGMWDGKPVEIVYAPQASQGRY